MRKNLIAVAILSGIAFNVSAYQQDQVFDKNGEIKIPSSEEIIEKGKSKGVEESKYITVDKLSSLSAISDKEQQLSFIKKEMSEKNTDVVYVKSNSGDMYVPINAYLLIRGYEDLAIELVKSFNTKPFQFFKFNNSDSSDMGIAIEQGNFEYVSGVVDKLDDVNKRFKYNGEKGFTLLMIAANIKKPETYSIVSTLLTNGADINLMSYNDINALTLAQEKENKYFLKAYSDYITKIEKGVNSFEENTLRPMNKREEAKRIESNLKNGMLDNIIDKGEEYKAIYTMIINGYHEPAEMIIDKMLEDDRFDPNYVDDDGISIFMTTALSDINGGDVEMAKKLIELGANINYKNKDGFHAGEAAIKKDAYKVLFVMIKNGFDPFNTVASNGMDLFDMALRTDPMAVNSATLIREIVFAMSKNDFDMEKMSKE